MPTLLITGASRGIGQELVRQYRADGWRVIATVRKTPPEGVEADVVLTLDAGDGDSIAALKQAVGSEPVDVLWNNAGVYLDKNTPLGSLDYEVWAETLWINSIAPIRIAAALADNVAASERKVMAFTTSRMGSIGSLGGGGAYAYRSSKAALNMAAEILRHDMTPRGISTVLLHPGWVRTDMGGPSADIGVVASARGMKRIVDNLTPAQSGAILDYSGKAIPW